MALLREWSLPEWQILAKFPGRFSSVFDRFSHLTSTFEVGELWGTYTATRMQILNLVNCLEPELWSKMYQKKCFSPPMSQFGSLKTLLFWAPMTLGLCPWERAQNFRHFRAMDSFWDGLEPELWPFLCFHTFSNIFMYFSPYFSPPWLIFNHQGKFWAHTLNFWAQRGSSSLPNSFHPYIFEPREFLIFFWTRSPLIFRFLMIYRWKTYGNPQVNQATWFATSPG